MNICIKISNYLYKHINSPGQNSTDILADQVHIPKPSPSRLRRCFFSIPAGELVKAKLILDILFIHIYIYACSGFQNKLYNTYIYICHKYTHIYIYTYYVCLPILFFFLHHFLVVKCFIVVEWGCLKATKKKLLKTSSNEALNAWWLVPPSVWLNLTVYQFIMGYSEIHWDIFRRISRCSKHFKPMHE